MYRVSRLCPTGKLEMALCIDDAAGATLKVEGSPACAAP
jgi:hypothetical protein